MIISISMHNCISKALFSQLQFTVLSDWFVVALHCCTVKIRDPAEQTTSVHLIGLRLRSITLLLSSEAACGCELRHLTPTHTLINTQRHRPLQSCMHRFYTDA